MTSRDALTGGRTNSASTWRTAAPLQTQYSVPEALSTAPFEFDSTLSLGPLPEWARSPQTHSFVGKIFGTDALGSCTSIGFMASSEWCPAPPVADEFDARRRRPDHVHRRLMYFANVALWLARSSGAGFRVVFERDECRPDFREVVPAVNLVHPFVPLPSYGSHRLRARDLVLARRLYRAIRDLPQPSTVLTAVRFLSLALAEPMWEVRTLLLWTAIEAVFAPPKATSDATRTLIGRLHSYIHRQAPARWYRTDLLRDLYAERSDIVHGARFSDVTTRKSLRTLTQSERVVALALRAILIDPNEIRALCGTRRETHLGQCPKASYGPGRSPWRSR